MLIFNRQLVISIRVKKNPKNSHKKKYKINNKIHLFNNKIHLINNKIIL